jgi:cytosine/creatinine deaminase
MAPPTAPSHDDLVADGYLILPGLVEPHAHLDKAFLAERVHNPTGDLMGAINAMTEAAPTITFDDIVERAERAARLMVRNGVVAIRTHADVTAGDGLLHVRALIEVRRRLHDTAPIQVCALMHWPTTGPQGAAHRDALAEAIELGVDVVGGCPHLEDEPEAAIDGFLEAAERAGLPVDLHTDETLNPSMLTLEHLADRVRASGFANSVVASHCVSLGMQEHHAQRRVAHKVAAAGIRVIALPHTNLFLQGREHQAAMPRGLTAVAALRAAGVDVAAGADNLQDPFNPMGRGDPLETAALMVMAAHLSPDAALHMVTGAAAAAIGVGDHGQTSQERVRRPGSVAVRAATVREAIAFGTADRLLLPATSIVADETYK